MERWAHKVICLFLIFIIIFVCTALPIKVSGIFASKGKTGKIILSCLACFGGGVFLGTYLLHMAPEVREMLEESLLIPNDIDYPIPELITVSGFFLVMLIEKVVMDWSRRKDKSVEPSLVKTDKSNNQELSTNVMLTSVQPSKTLDVHSNGTGLSQESESPAGASVIVMEPEFRQEPHRHENEQASMARSLILLIALSLDCIFEGITLGLKSTVTDVWNMFIAIISHEIVIAFSLGLELIKYNTPKRTLLAAFIYGITAPIGITIGTVLVEAVDSSSTDIELVNGILQGIAAGVFLYVTFFEILMAQVEYHPPWSKVLPIILGVAVMAALAAIPEGDEEEEDILTTATPMFWRPAISLE